VLAIAMGVSGVAGGQTEAPPADTPPPPPPPTWTPPAYQFLPQNEDWSGLADVPTDLRTDFWDAIKYVPLSKDGAIWASFGGSTRLRLESWWHFNFLPSAQGDDTFLLWRARLHGDFHFGPNLRVFAEGKSALSTDRDLPGGKRTLDVDTLALQQLFIDVRFPFGEATGGKPADALTVRPGRQMYLYGRERIVSPLAWSNTLRTWDGVTGLFTLGGWRVDAWWSQFVPVLKYDFNRSDAEQEFYGAHATGKVGGGVGLDAYFLGLHNGDPQTYNGTTGIEDRYTLGGRIHGVMPGTSFNYDLEAAYQFGRVGSGDVSAWMLGARAGWTFEGVWSTPQVYGGIDAGSGDRNPGGDVQTFNQLYPLGHAYFGYIDLVGRQNALGPFVGASFKPLGGLTVQLQANFFWRDTANDALYNAGGGVVRAGNLSNAHEVGQELDLTVSHRFDRHLTGELGYCHFFAGQFIRESGPSNDIDFLYVQVQYTF